MKKSKQMCIASEPSNSQKKKKKEVSQASWGRNSVYIYCLSYSVHYNKKSRVREFINSRVYGSRLGAWEVQGRLQQSQYLVTACSLSPLQTAPSCQVLLVEGANELPLASFIKGTDSNPRAHCFWASGRGQVAMVRSMWWNKNCPSQD